MRALVIGDAHVSDVPPSSRTATYTQDILDKLEWCSHKAVELGCDALVQAGDMFHIKNPQKNSHSLVVATHKALTAGGLPVLIAPGNHDLSNDRLNSLPSQPLGALCSMRGVEYLIGPNKNFPLFGIPWLANWERDLSRWLKKYLEFDETQVEETLLVTHAPLFPSYQKPPYDYISYTDWAAQMQWSGYVYYGHIHDHYGVILEEGVTFCNQGAISRGSLHESSLNRKPAVTLWDSEAQVNKFQRVEVPHKPISEVFLLKEYEAKKYAEKEMETFVNTIGATEISTNSFEEALSVIQSLDVDEDTKKLALQLLEEV